MSLALQAYQSAMSNAKKIDKDIAENDGLNYVFVYFVYLFELVAYKCVATFMLFFLCVEKNICVNAYK